VAPTRQREKEKKALLLRYWAGPSVGPRGERRTSHCRGPARARENRPILRSFGPPGKYSFLFFYFSFFSLFVYFPKPFQIKFSKPKQNKVNAHHKIN
jgi:hypothetical protein